MAETQENIGHCKHGEFVLLDGCPKCIKERQISEAVEANRAPVPEELKPVLEDEEVDGLSEEEEVYEAAKADQPEPSAQTALATAPGSDVEVLGYYGEAIKLQQYAESRVIATVEDNKSATDDLSLIARLKKAMEEKRKEKLAPLQSQVTGINDTFKVFMEPISEAEKITKNKMLIYQNEQRRVREEQEDINRKKMELAKAEMKLNGELSQPVDLVEVAPEPAKRVSTDLGTAGQRDNWKYEIVDPLAVPREYLMVDTAMLSAIAKRHHDQKPVAGVRFYNEPIIAVRAR